MEITGIVRTAGGVLLVVALLSLGPGVAAIALQRPDATAGFLVTFIASAFVGGSLLLAVRGRQARTTPREAILALIIGWLVAALAAAPPLMGPDAGLMRAYFDALSALTTTGFPPAAAATGDGLRLFWWNLLQWIGGAASLLAILAALAALNIVGAGVQKSPLFTLAPEHVLSRAARLARIVGLAYGAVTAVVFFGVWANGARFADALCVAMASVATGGLVFLDGELTAWRLPTGALGFAGVGLLFGALSFAVHWEALRGRAPAGHVRDRESILFIALMWVWLSLAAFADPPRDGDEAVRLTFEALALTSTAAWDAAPLGVSAMGAPVLFAAVLFGGAAISTTGGLKLQRIIMLVKEIGLELSALAHPSSVSNKRVERAGAGRIATVSGLGVYAVSYGLAVALIIAALGAAGMPLDIAVGAATAALANAGPMLHAAVGARDVATLLASEPALVTLCAGMMLGRVEVLAVFAVLLPGYWRG